jgi:SpoIID/LytB domain protein
MLGATLGIAGLLGTVAPAGAADSFTFTGGGWGHGVGMSQWGAKARADAGQSAADIVGAYYPGAAISPMPAVNIRVHLADAASTSLAFTGNGAIAANATTIRGVASGETVTVQAGASTMTVTAAGQSPVTLTAADAFIATWDAANGNVRVSATGNRERYGRVIIRLAAPGTLQIVNDSLTMQQYLNGIAEMPSSWGAAALQAQAMAARTYAYRRVVSPRSAAYDILSTTSDQVYAGYEKEAGASGTRWTDAVAATDGQYLTYAGQPIEAVYSSSNGGYGDDSTYVFATDRPYLRGIVDPFDNTAGNSNFRWSRTYSGAELGQYLRANRSTDIGDVTNVEFLGQFGRSGRIDRATVRLTGTRGTSDITGAQLRSMINTSEASLSRQLLSTLLFFRPIGSFDGLSYGPDGIRATGWTAFQGSQQPGLAHVYVNGVFRAGVEATRARPDVAAAVPGASPTTGFDVSVPATGADNTVCVYGVTPNGSANILMGCRSITVPTQPFGSIDILGPTRGGVRAAGWLIDPNTGAPIPVHVYVNGELRRSVEAAVPRPDVNAVFGYGAAHGFDEIVPVDQLTNTVCIYAINVGPGDNQLLGCRVVTTPVSPFGSVDLVAGTPDGVQVAGWAIDPDVTDPIDVHVYVDGAGVALNANGDRPDVGAAFAGSGNAHGFNALVRAAPGNHRVCLYAINVRGGGNSLLECRTVFVPSNPFGNIDVVASGAGGLRVAGWAIDPNTAEPIDVHVYVGPAGTAVHADRPRPDLAGPFPSAGTAHGFDTTVAGASGQSVCVYAINSGPGANVLLGCRAAS